MDQWGASDGTNEYQLYPLQTVTLIKLIAALKLTLLITITADTKLCLEKYKESLALTVYNLRARGAKVVTECLQHEGWAKFKYEEPVSVWQERIRTNSVSVSGNLHAISDIWILIFAEPRGLGSPIVYSQQACRMDHPRGR